MFFQFFLSRISCWLASTIGARSESLEMCKSGKPRNMCRSALCTVDDASCFPVIRLGPKTSVYEKHVSVKSTVTRLRCDLLCNNITRVQQAKRKGAHLSTIRLSPRICTKRDAPKYMAIFRASSRHMESCETDPISRKGISQHRESLPRILCVQRSITGVLQRDCEKESSTND